LEHEGEMILFLLDIIEVAEVSIYFRHCSSFLIIVMQSHTGEAMARAFQAMLEQFGLTQKVHQRLPVPSHPE
jgi:hypothetical protein